MAAGMNIFTLFGSILIDNDKADESIKKTEKNAEGLAGKLGSGIATAAKWGAGLAAGAGVAITGMLALTDKAADTARQIDTLSQQTGMTTDAYQEWNYVMEKAGYSMEQAAGDISALGEKALDAANGAGEGAELFGKLGITVKDTGGKMKTQEQIFNETIVALQGMEDETERNAIASALLSTTGEELTSVLNMTGEELEAMKDKSHELGLVMSGEAIDANAEFGRSMDDVKGKIETVFTNIAMQFMPILQELMDWVMAHMPEIQNVIDVAFDVISTVVSVAYEWFKTYLLPIFKNLFDWVVDNWPTIKDTIKGVFDTISPLVKSLWELFSVSLLPIFKTLFSWVADNFPGIGSNISTAFGVIVDVATGVVDVFIDIVDGIKSAIEWFDKWTNKNAGKSTVSLNNHGGGGRSFGGIDGSNANGLAYVPFDGYVSELHKGEEVLRADDPRNQNNGGGNSGVVITGNQFIIREEADIKKVAQELDILQRQKSRGRGLAII